MTTDRRYYVARGRSLAAIEEWQAEHKATNAYLRALIAELGLGDARIVSRGTYAEGFLFDTKPSDADAAAVGLRGKRQELSDRRSAVVHRPMRRTKVGKKLAAAMMERHYPDHHTFTCALFPEMQRGIPGWQVPDYDGPASMCLTYATFEELGDRYVIGLPSYAKEVPPDAVPLKMSEYWRLHEERSAS